MLINGVDIEKYAMSFDEFHLSSVLQFLEVFKWSPEAEEWLREHLKSGRPTGRPRQSEDLYHVNVTLGPGTVVRFHKDAGCEGKIIRYKIKSCHTKATGRLSYEECSKCNYYREEFRGG